MDYADWKAPRADAEYLIWPTPAEWPAMAAANARSLAAATVPLVQGVPVAALRREMRDFVGLPEDRPTFVTGHQAELWHPGVWAKNALIDAAARATEGGAMHVAVDTDAPKHLDVRWPGYRVPITDDERLGDAPWTGLLEPPTPVHLGRIERDLHVARGTFGFEPMLDAWVGHLRDATFEGSSGSDLAKAIVAAGHRLDWSLGLDYAAHTLGPWLGSRPWLTFVYHVLSRAPSFAASYNRALAGYRDAQGIVSTSRPMPDLAVADQEVEVPFWLDEVGNAPGRHRCTVMLRGDKLYFRSPAGDDALELDPTLAADVATERLRGFLLARRLRIAPRALTLTTFVRLFVADVFVHGIGGGRYDQVADRLIADHFGLAPPRFGVTTATMYLPQAQRRERACLPCVVHDGHRLRHALLGERKRAMVAAIEAAPRRSVQRRTLFASMRRALRDAEATDARVSHWRHTLGEMKDRAAEDATIFDREVFYAIQPQGRLTSMIDRYRDAFKAR